MRHWRPSRLLFLFGLAAVGYLSAFAMGPAGILFVALLAVGIVGELGFWVELISRWRGRARS